MPPPPLPEALAAFPIYVLLPRRALYRIHRAHRGPWWFTSGTQRRFDLDRPRGTCYLAEEALGAFVEAFQHVGVIMPVAEIAARAISILSVPAEVTLADCTDPRSRAFGITGEIHSSPDRRLTQAWAAAFAAAGFGGVRYLVRHDPSQRRFGIALFGAAGEASWATGATRPIGDHLVREADRIFGILVR